MWYSKGVLYYIFIIAVKNIHPLLDIDWLHYPLDLYMAANIVIAAAYKQKM